MRAASRFFRGLSCRSQPSLPLQALTFSTISHSHPDRPHAPPAITQSERTTMTPAEARAEINRANSQHSTGPKTPEGKKRISLNALRHGLTGQIVVMPTEDLQAYQRHLQS